MSIYFTRDDGRFKKAILRLYGLNVLPCPVGIIPGLAAIIVFFGVLFMEICVRKGMEVQV